jgi:hypothetical protein
MTARTVSLVTPLLLSAGCVHVFPPPPVPGPVQPPAYEAPIPPGLGRVYVDVVDGPTHVRAVKPVSVEVPLGDDMVYEDTVLETQQACRTPCVLDLPLGHQLLSFPMHGSRKVEVDEVAVSLTPSLYRRALGSRQSGGAGSVLGILGTTFGGLSFATGAALLPVGLATGNSGLTTSGAITLGAGAALMTIGIWAIAGNPALERPGAGAQYDVGP